jgi:hypothetical protein
MGVLTLNHKQFIIDTTKVLIVGIYVRCFMKRLSVFLFASVSGALLLIAGCAHYNAIPLKWLEDSTSTKKGVTLSYKVFTKADCKKYLGRDILKRKYQPLQLTIVNNTNDTYTISHNSLSLPTASIEAVAKKVHTSTVGRAVGYGAAAILTCGLFAIPAIVDGIGSAEANEQLDDDFATKAFRLDGALKPHTMVNGIVFVAREAFDENFTLTLYNEKNGQVLVLNSLSTATTIK